jgi:AAA+ superfamily predicted ATPase
MAWNYRKRIKIAPGVNLNLSKGGVSTSVGPRGAKVSLGKNGVYLNTSIPGTGLYYRTKLSGKSSSRSMPRIMTTKNNGNSQEQGCRYGCGVILILGCIGCLLFIISTPFEVMTKKGLISIGFLLVMAISAFLIYLPVFKKKTKKDEVIYDEEGRIIYEPNNEKTSSDKKSSSSGSIVGRTNTTRYDFLLKWYNDAEKVILEKAEKEETATKNILESTSDPVKKLFLQSFIDHYRVNRISKLLDLCEYGDEEMNDELDPLFEKVAKEAIKHYYVNEKDLFYWAGYGITPERIKQISNQLFECGITYKEAANGLVKVVVKDSSSLENILKKCDGHSLLSTEDKIKLKEFYAQKKEELVSGQALYTELPYEEGAIKTYTDVIHAFDALCSCEDKWSIEIMEAIIMANMLIKSSTDPHHRNRIKFMEKEMFNYVRPCKDTNAPCFYFKDQGIKIYIYPKFVVTAHNSREFEVTDIKNLNMEFERTNYVETSQFYTPKDAKFIKYTYKHTTIRGEKDARYSDNPRYSIYEHGNITFYPNKLTMEFSNSSAVENFYKKIQLLRGNGKEFVEDNFGASEKFFNKALDVAIPLCNFYDEIGRNRKVMHTVDTALTDEVGSSDEKLRYLFLADLLRCYELLGHDVSDMFTTEGLPLLVVESHILFKTRPTSYSYIQKREYKDFISSICEVNKSAKGLYPIGKAEDFFYLKEVFNDCGLHDLTVSYFSLFYRFFSVVAKADNRITPEESRWLEKLMLLSDSKKDYGLEVFEKRADVEMKQVKKEQVPLSGDETNPLEELQTLIGLTEVKEEVSSLANFVKIQKEREKKGLKPVGLSYHCVFTGNPGTGKTTVARILAEIYRNLGILKKGHLVETDRSGLVAEYVGQTAVKTNKIIDSALDGVLFIDEAYSLVQGGGSDYGQEAIATLLKRMEDERDRLVVILAGYSEDMKRFINSNPGLQSRFNRYIHFADYTSNELKQIFMLNVQKNQYKLDSDGQSLLTQILTIAVEHKDKNFGNGRFVRNLFEKTIQNQAMRLSSQPSITTEELSMLTAEDVPETN